VAKLPEDDLKMNLKNLLLAGVAAPFVIAGCGGGEGGSSSGTGTLAIRLADAPDPDITEINVRIARVQANVDGQWVTIAEPDATFNLLDFALTDTLVGQASVPAGTYTQVRLVIPEANYVDDTGSHELEIPSGDTSGFKINVNAPVEPNEVTTILLDWNAKDSIVRTGSGKTILKPTIRGVVKVLSGTVTGIASDGTANLVNAEVKATYVAGPSYPVDTVVNTTYSLGDDPNTAEDETGKFKVWALLPGTYKLNLTYTAPDSTVKVAEVLDVNVAAQSNTDVGVVTLN